ncbi:hypothetical protein ACFXAF_29650 [Kitasatospora sp. NPDC059463]|uniref:hypothetical protein n=1 Tax=unclassified Kitasatospora TaxID=2633591 RepID=UPI0036A60420
MDETAATPPVHLVAPAEAATEKPASPSVRVPLWLVTGIGGLAVGAGSVGLAWGLSSSGTATGPSAVATATPSKSEVFTLDGQMTLGSNARDTAAGCVGRGGYDDIARGASVTVFDEDGTVLATGSLGTGRSKGTTGCVFPIEVIGVPVGPKFYQVEVSHRGKVTLSRADAEAGLLGVSLS